MKDTKIVGVIIGHLLAGCFSVCIMATMIALTVKLIQWIV